MKNHQLFNILKSFLKLGFIAFGGGYAVAPLLHHEAVVRRKWISDEELTDMLGISQALPGVIFTNSATIIGYRVSGFWGALIATSASIFPTFVITIIVTAFFWNYTDNVLVQKAFTGILIGITALIAYTIHKMWKTAIKDYFDILIVIFSSAALVIFRLNAVIVILGFAAIGFIRSLVVIRRGGTNN